MCDKEFELLSPRLHHFTHLTLSLYLALLCMTCNALPYVTLSYLTLCDSSIACTFPFTLPLDIYLYRYLRPSTPLLIPLRIPFTREI